MFSTAVGEAWSRPVPVWYEWTDPVVSLFSFTGAPKVARLRSHPRAHILVANHPDEAEHWISIAGPVELGPVEPAWIERIAARYWDLSNPERAEVVREWLTQVDSMIAIRLEPVHVRRYGF